MSVELVRIVDSIHRDKNIPKEILFEGIESALATAAKKHYPDAEEIKVQIDQETGKVATFADGVPVDPPGLRPDRRADGQAGHHPEDPRGRARQRLRRVRGPQGRPGHRHRAAVRRRGRHRQPGQDRRHPAPQRADPRRDLPPQRAGPGDHPRRPQGRPAGEDHPQPDPPRLRPPALRAGDPRDRRPDHRHPGPGPRGGLPLQGRRDLDRHQGRRRGGVRGRAGHADQEHRRRARRRANRHRPLERVASGA